MLKTKLAQKTKNNRNITWRGGCFAIIPLKTIYVNISQIYVTHCLTIIWWKTYKIFPIKIGNIFFQKKHFYYLFTLNYVELHSIYGIPIYHLSYIVYPTITNLIKQREKHDVNYLLVLLLLSIIVYLYSLGKRFWCTYLMYYEKN